MPPKITKCVLDTCRRGMKTVEVNLKSSQLESGENCGEEKMALLTITRISRFSQIKPVSQAFCRVLSTQPIQSVIELHNNKYESDDYFNLTPKILTYLDQVNFSIKTNSSAAENESEPVQ